jgi:hypothetical protein
VAAGAAGSALAIEAGRHAEEDEGPQPQPPERTNGHRPGQVPEGAIA